MLLAMLALRPAFAETISGTVVRIIEGDRLIIEDAAKKRYTVRLADIDAPERNQPFGKEASRSLAAPSMLVFVP